MLTKTLITIGLIATTVYLGDRVFGRRFGKLVSALALLLIVYSIADPPGARNLVQSINRQLSLAADRIEYVFSK